ncbi:protein male-specific lethal-1-like [Bradysia coprophila]|uniref:protein male-specific lethal-1-like n=1 Tax=Bradysia coprophila TaxID=38358 RepID=UPI00187D97F5|nr:protein male-specific lethal-1-like [Bradysia coprophila]
MDTNKKVNRRSGYNNLDHLYCHTNTNDSGNYVRSKTSSNDMDMGSVLKEIKQLKSTINLHLDLIQDQSDQLISKDKLLMVLKKENDLLKAKLEKSERRNKSNSKKDESHQPIVEQLMADLPEMNAKQDMLKKMSSTLLNKCTLKLNALEDVLGFDIDNPTADSHTDNSSSNIPNTGRDSNAFVADITTTTNNNNKNSTKNGSIIGTSDGKPISKIVLQRVIVGDVEELAIKSEKKDSPVKIKYEKLSPTHSQLHPNLSNCVEKSMINSQRAHNETCKTTDGVVSAKSNPSNVNKPESSRKNHRKNGKKDHKSSKTKSDDNASRHSREDKTKTQKKITAPSNPPTPAPVQSLSRPLPAPSPVQSTSRPASQCNRNSVMMTTELYHTREWQMDEIEVLVNKQISDCGEEGLNGDEINLEIPRWCIRETSNGAYSSEGMEDLSDDVFIKRHARLEHAEKKRKKWDVQRIREIRNIERLKRRHCKPVESNEQTAESMTSFYPSPENVKYVHVADELPVVAFGEPIHVPQSAEFSLPWDHQYRETPYSPASQSATISNTDHTTIVFRSKKRPTRRVTSTQLPKAPSKSRSSKRSRR